MKDKFQNELEDLIQKFAEQGLPAHEIARNLESAASVWWEFSAVKPKNPMNWLKEKDT